MYVYNPVTRESAAIMSLRPVWVTKKNPVLKQNQNKHTTINKQLV